MSKEKDDKRVKSVSSTTKAKGIQNVERVEEVKGASAVGAVDRVGSIGKAGRVAALSLQQREKLMNLIAEEATRLTAQGAISDSQRAIVEHAVKMAIDAALVDGDDKSKK